MPRPRLIERRRPRRDQPDRPKPLMQQRAPSGLSTLLLRNTRRSGGDPLPLRTPLPITAPPPHRSSCVSSSSFFLVMLLIFVAAFGSHATSATALPLSCGPTYHIRDPGAFTFGCAGGGTTHIVQVSSRDVTLIVMPSTRVYQLVIRLDPTGGLSDGIADRFKFIQNTTDASISILNFLGQPPGTEAPTGVSIQVSDLTAPANSRISFSGLRLNASAIVIDHWNTTVEADTLTARVALWMSSCNFANMSTFTISNSVVRLLVPSSASVGPTSHYAAIEHVSLVEGSPMLTLADTVVSATMHHANGSEAARRQTPWQSVSAIRILPIGAVPRSAEVAARVACTRCTLVVESARSLRTAGLLLDAVVPKSITFRGSRMSSIAGPHGVGHVAFVLVHPVNINVSTATAYTITAEEQTVRVQGIPDLFPVAPRLPNETVAVPSIAVVIVVPKRSDTAPPVWTGSLSLDVVMAAMHTVIFATVNASAPAGTVGLLHFINASMSDGNLSLNVMAGSSAVMQHRPAASGIDSAVGVWIKNATVAATQIALGGLNCTTTTAAKEGAAFLDAAVIAVHFAPSLSSSPPETTAAVSVALETEVTFTATRSVSVAHVIGTSTAPAIHVTHLTASTVWLSIANASEPGNAAPVVAALVNVDAAATAMSTASSVTAVIARGLVRVDAPIGTAALVRCVGSAFHNNLSSSACTSVDVSLASITATALLTGQNVHGILALTRTAAAFMVVAGRMALVGHDRLSGVAEAVTSDGSGSMRVLPGARVILQAATVSALHSPTAQFSLDGPAARVSLTAVNGDAAVVDADDPAGRTPGGHRCNASVAVSAGGMLTLNSSVASAALVANTNRSGSAGEENEMSTVVIDVAASFVSVLGFTSGTLVDLTNITFADSVDARVAVTALAGAQVTINATGSVGTAAFVLGEPVRAPASIAGTVSNGSSVNVTGDLDGYVIRVPRSESALPSDNISQASRRISVTFDNSQTDVRGLAGNARVLDLSGRPLNAGGRSYHAATVHARCADVSSGAANNCAVTVSAYRHAALLATDVGWNVSARALPVNVLDVAVEGPVAIGVASSGRGSASLLRVGVFEPTFGNGATSFSATIVRIFVNTAESATAVHGPTRISVSAARGAASVMSVHPVRVPFTVSTALENVTAHVTSVASSDAFRTVAFAVGAPEASTAWNAVSALTRGGSFVMNAVRTTILVESTGVTSDVGVAVIRIDKGDGAASTVSITIAEANWTVRSAGPSSSSLNAIAVGSGVNDTVDQIEVAVTQRSNLACVGYGFNSIAVVSLRARYVTDTANLTINDGSNVLATAQFVPDNDGVYAETVAVRIGDPYVAAWAPVQPDPHLTGFWGQLVVNIAAASIQVDLKSASHGLQSPAISRPRPRTWATAAILIVNQAVKGPEATAATVAVGTGMLGAQPLPVWPVISEVPSGGGNGTTTLLPLPKTEFGNVSVTLSGATLWGSVIAFSQLAPPSVHHGASSSNVSRSIAILDSLIAPPLIDGQLRGAAGHVLIGRCLDASITIARSNVVNGTIQFASFNASGQQASGLNTLTISDVRATYIGTAPTVASGASDSTFDVDAVQRHVAADPDLVTVVVRIGNVFDGALSTPPSSAFVNITKLRVFGICSTPLGCRGLSVGPVERPTNTSSAMTTGASSRLTLSVRSTRVQATGWSFPWFAVNSAVRADHGLQAPIDQTLSAVLNAAADTTQWPQHALGCVFDVVTAGAAPLSGTRIAINDVVITADHRATMGNLSRIASEDASVVDPVLAIVGTTHVVSRSLVAMRVDAAPQGISMNHASSDLHLVDAQVTSRLIVAAGATFSSATPPTIAPPAETPAAVVVRPAMMGVSVGSVATRNLTLISLTATVETTWLRFAPATPTEAVVDVPKFSRLITGTNAVSIRASVGSTTLRRIAADAAARMVDVVVTGLGAKPARGFILNHAFHAVHGEGGQTSAPVVFSVSDVTSRVVVDVRAENCVPSDFVMQAATRAIKVSAVGGFSNATSTVEGNCGSLQGFVASLFGAQQPLRVSNVSTTMTQSGPTRGASSHGFIVGGSTNTVPAAAGVSLSLNNVSVTINASMLGAHEPAPHGEEQASGPYSVVGIGMYRSASRDLRGGGISLNRTQVTIVAPPPPPGIVAHTAVAAGSTVRGLDLGVTREFAGSIELHSTVVSIATLVPPNATPVNHPNSSSFSAGEQYHAFVIAPDVTATASDACFNLSAVHIQDSTLTVSAQTTFVRSRDADAISIDGIRCLPTVTIAHSTVLSTVGGIVGGESVLHASALAITAGGTSRRPLPQQIHLSRSDLVATVQSGTVCATANNCSALEVAAVHLDFNGTGVVVDVAVTSTNLGSAITQASGGANLSSSMMAAVSAVCVNMVSGADAAVAASLTGTNCRAVTAGSGTRTAPPQSLSLSFARLRRALSTASSPVTTTPSWTVAIANNTMLAVVNVGARRVAAHAQVVVLDAAPSPNDLGAIRAAVSVHMTNTEAVLLERALIAGAAIASSASFVTLASGGLNVTGSITGNELTTRPVRGPGSRSAERNQTLGTIVLPSGPAGAAPSYANSQTIAKFKVSRNALEAAVSNGTRSRIAFALLSPAVQNQHASATSATAEIATVAARSLPVLVVTSLGGGNATCSMDHPLPCGFDIVSASSGWMDAAGGDRLSVNAASTPAFLRVVASTAASSEAPCDSYATQLPEEDRIEAPPWWTRARVAAAIDAGDPRMVEALLSHGFAPFGIGLNVTMGGASSFGRGADSIASVAMQCRVGNPTLTESRSLMPRSPRTATATATTTKAPPPPPPPHGVATNTASTTVVVPKPTPPPPILPVPVQTAADAATTSTTVVGSISSPGAALQMARVVGILSLAKRCRGAVSSAEVDDELTEPLEFPQSLAPFVRFGPERGQYHRGTVVGNALVAICLTGFAIAVAAVCVVAGIFSPKSSTLYYSASSASAPVPLIQRALSASRFPGAAVVAFALGLDGSVTAVVTLAAKSDDMAIDGAVIAGGALLNVAVFVAAVGFLHRLIVRPIRTAFETTSGGLKLPPLSFVPVAIVRTGNRYAFKGSSGADRNARPRAERLFRWLLFGSWSWLPSTDREVAASANDPRTTASPAPGSPVSDLHRPFLSTSPTSSVQRHDIQSSSPTHSGTDTAAGGTADLAHEDLRARAFTSQAAFEQLGVVLTRYRGTAHSDNTAFARSTAKVSPWFLAVDLFLTLLVAVSQGLAYVACDEAVALALAANVLGLVLALGVMPYSVPAKNVLLVAMNAAMVAASACTVAAVRASTDARAEVMAEMAGKAAACAAMVGFVSIALSLMRFVMLRGILKASLTIDIQALLSTFGTDNAAAYPDGGNQGTPAIRSQVSRRGFDEYSFPVLAEPSSGAVLSVPTPSDQPAPAPAPVTEMAPLPPPQEQQPREGDDIDLDALLDDSGNDAGGPAVLINESFDVTGNASFYSASAARAVYRTAEGERRYKDLEALLRRGSADSAAPPATGSAGGRPSAPPPMPGGGTDFALSSPNLPSQPGGRHPAVSAHEDVFA